jgi:hypothetical protein
MLLKIDKSDIDSYKLYSLCTILNEENIPHTDSEIKDSTLVRRVCDLFDVSSDSVVPNDLSLDPVKYYAEGKAIIDNRLSLRSSLRIILAVCYQLLDDMYHSYE